MRIVLLLIQISLIAAKVEHDYDTDYLDDYSAVEDSESESNDVETKPRLHKKKTIKFTIETEQSNETVASEKEKQKKISELNTFEIEDLKNDEQKTFGNKKPVRRNVEQKTTEKVELAKNGTQKTFEKKEQEKNGEIMNVEEDEPKKNSEEKTFEEHDRKKNCEHRTFEKEEPKRNETSHKKKHKSHHHHHHHRRNKLPENLVPKKEVSVESPEKVVPRKEVTRKPTTLHNYPFAVSIQRKGVHYASGALIDTKWVLSSGAEFYNVRESIKLFRIRLGSIDCKKGGSLIPIQRIEVHPSYIYGQPNFDLSLLRLANPAIFSDVIRPVVLSKIRTKVISAKFMTTYWSRIIINGEPLPKDAKERTNQNVMRVLTQNLIPRNECLYHMKSHNVTLHDSTLCLVPGNKHHSMCLPDSGAPVLADDGLWGITSGWTSKDCMDTQSPTTFTRLSSLVVRTWLDSQLLDVRDGS